MTPLTQVLVAIVVSFVAGFALAIFLLKSRYKALKASVWVELGTDEDDESIVVFRSFDKSAVHAVRECLGDAERSYSVMSITREA